MIFSIFNGGDFHMMDWWFTLFGPFTWLVMALGMGLYIAGSVVIAYYVHRDAIRRGIVNSEVWLIIALIFNIVGLVIYLIFRGNHEHDQPIENIRENKFLNK